MSDPDLDMDCTCIGDYATPPDDGCPLHGGEFFGPADPTDADEPEQSKRAVHDAPVGGELL